MDKLVINQNKKLGQPTIKSQQEWIFRVAKVDLNCFIDQCKWWVNSF